MIERQPYLPRFMAGGPGNPLGARAMYLGSTVYRIHGTNQPSTIGKFVSSGCIGMLNEDVSDLFDRVKVGTRVVVLPGSPPPAAPASAQPVPGPNAGPPAPMPGSRHPADRGAAAARAGDGALTVQASSHEFESSGSRERAARFSFMRSASDAASVTPVSAMSRP